MGSSTGKQLENSHITHLGWSISKRFLWICPFAPSFSHRFLSDRCLCVVLLPKSASFFPQAMLLLRVRLFQFPGVGNIWL
jgi:hypothetical protein